MTLRMRPDARRAYIAHHWQHLSDREMANNCLCTVGVLMKTRQQMGLRRAEANNPFGLNGDYLGPVPARPKGYTEEQLDWATDNPDSREAGMMLTMHRDFKRIKPRRWE